MKIRQGENIISAHVADCFVTQSEAASISGKAQNNYARYINANKVKIVTHSVGDDNMYSLKEVSEDTRRMIAEEVEQKLGRTIDGLETTLKDKQRMLENARAELASVRAAAKAAEKASKQPLSNADRQRLDLELLQGQVKLDKARLRKFNLTNEKIVLQLKEICKQELVEVIQPIIARLDQALSPHATEVHQILGEMLLKLQSEVVFNEIGDEEQSLMNEARQENDYLDGKTQN
jgi:multidrug efflux pump subunit AcrB